MKLKYYLLGTALVAMASVTFTSCSDDDDPSVPAEEELVVPSEVTRVKIGELAALPVISGNGDYQAWSLDPSVCEVVKGDDGACYIEGYKNGNTSVIVSDAAGLYKKIAVSVYTTETMELSHTALEFVTPLGFSSTNRECHVVLGNGEYTITSDNEKVAATIDPETGEIAITATSGKDEYTAVVTVSDISALTASITVTVKATFDAFTQADIDEILAKTEGDVFAQVQGLDDNRPYYYRGSYISRGNKYTNDGTTCVLGWNYENWGSVYGRLDFTYPASATVGEEVSGKLNFLYYPWGSYAKAEDVEGTVKIIEDNDQRIVALWWLVDMDNECINRAYVVHYKN